MFLIIVIIAVAIGILFCTVLTSLIVFLYNLDKKNDKLKNKSLKVLIPSVIVWVLLIGVNIVLLVNYLNKNKDDLLDKSVRIPAEMVGKGFALTFQSFEKNWDKNRLQQLQNLHISFSSMDYEIQDETKIYDIEFIFDNASPAEVKLYLKDILNNHYLLVCDKDDFVYTIPLVYTNIRKTQTKEQTDNGVTSTTQVTSTQYSNTIIPFGKSRFRFNVTVPNDVEITHARFVNTVIPINQ
jgi:amino acid transporter